MAMWTCIDERARGENRRARVPRLEPLMPEMDDLDFRQRRLAFRAWHRGTREADLMIGGFADRYAKDVGHRRDRLVRSVARAAGRRHHGVGRLARQPVARSALPGPQMTALQGLDYIAKAMR